MLYYLQYLTTWNRRASFAAFDAAVNDKYGEASAVFAPSHGVLWAYEVDGTQMQLGAAAASPCAATLRLVLSEDALGRPTGLNLQSNSWDIGPWGCGVLMELSPNRESDGVSGYSITAASGYLWAINHFHQRIDETKALLRKVEELAVRKPKL